MTCPQVDYDSIAPTYNRRFVSDGQRQTGVVLRQLARIHQALLAAEQAGQDLVFMSHIRLEMLAGWK